MGIFLMIFQLFCFSVCLLICPSLVFAKSDGGLSNVELEWVVCEPNEATLFQKLKTSEGDPENRDVYYMETPDFTLFNKGAVVRTRIKNKSMRTSTKVHFQNEAQIPWDFLGDKDYKCEKDYYIDSPRLGCSLFSTPSMFKQIPSESQKNFLRNEVGFYAFDQLKVLGPARSMVWGWQEDGVSGESKLDIVVEAIRAPKDYLSIVLSVRVPLERQNEVFREVQSWLNRRKVQLCSGQSGKTRDLLEVLSKF